MVESRSGPRHAEHAETAGLKRERPGGRSVEDAKETEQLILTLNAATHEAVEIEKLDKAGQRHQLSERDCAELTGDDEIDDFLGAVQEAYEAGIAEGLGAEDGEDEADEEVVLWDLLLLRRRFVGSQLLRRGLRRSLLRRLLLRRLLRGVVFRPATAQEQRRKPIDQKTRNGSGSS